MHDARLMVLMWICLCYSYVCVCVDGRVFALILNMRRSTEIIYVYRYTIFVSLTIPYSHIPIFQLRLQLQQYITVKLFSAHAFLGQALMPFVVHYWYPGRADPLNLCVCESKCVFEYYNIFYRSIVDIYIYISNVDVRFIKHREIEFGYSIKSWTNIIHRHIVFVFMKIMKFNAPIGVPSSACEPAKSHHCSAATVESKWHFFSSSLLFLFFFVEEITLWIFF